MLNVKENQYTFAAFVYIYRDYVLQAVTLLVEKCRLVNLPTSFTYRKYWIESGDFTGQL
jgi:hypothetical protein